jgi:acetylornithine deacetylase
MRESPALADPASPVWDAVDAAIGDGAEAAFSFLERLVASPSTAASGGVAQASYAGRPDLLGRINPGGSPSLLLNGHVDVVPAESGRWAGDPFGPARADGWLTGEGGVRR